MTVTRAPEPQKQLIEETPEDKREAERSKVLDQALERAATQIAGALASLVALGLEDDVTWECASGTFTVRPKKPAVKMVRRGGERA